MEYIQPENRQQVEMLSMEMFISADNYKTSVGLQLYLAERIEKSGRRIWNYLHLL
jgi:hypothetical protein